MIICDDADIEIAAGGASWGGFVSWPSMYKHRENMYLRM